MMCLRVICVLIGLVSAARASAQEPEYYYPYETESEERTEVLLTDSVLFYRAVQTPVDLYDRIAGYDLSFVRQRRRGQDYQMQTTSVAGLELPSRYFSALRALGATEWGVAGLEPGDDRLGLAGGTRTFGFRSAEPSPAGRTSVYFSDRNYLMGVRAAYAGAAGRGWSLAGALDARMGRDLHIDGVFTSALTASFRAAKSFGDHLLSFALIVPPSMRGLRSMSTEETFTLTGNRLYNPAWGYQNGEVRNSHIRREFLPLAMADAHIQISETTELDAALGVEAGVSKWSTLGWYDARTPVPDNYRYLPSYTGDRETEEAWRTNDTRYTQIDWDKLWVENRMGGGEAIYALEDRVRRICRVQLRAGFTTHFDQRLTLRYGVNAKHESVRNYKQLRDLLGAHYLMDIDQFLVDDDAYGNLLQNDLRQPRRRVGEGDRFGYDYALRQSQVGVRVLMQYRADRFRVDLGAEVSDAMVRREGYFEKELFSGTRSYGRSARLHFTPYIFKLASGWSFSPKAYLGVALTAAAVVPEAEDLFLQPQYNNRTADNPALQKLWAAEVVFNYTGRVADVRAAAFITAVRDAMAAYRYYDDMAGVFSDLTASGIGTRSYGVECAATVRLTYRWQLSLAASAGVYEYAADPQITIVSDADNTPIDRAVSHMGGTRIGNAPQLTACARIAYFGRRGWGFRAGANFAGLRYVDPALLRRTERIARQAAQTPEAFARFTEQERLGDAFTLDGSLFKSFYFEGSRLTLSATVRNLLGTKNMVYAAYESLRVRRSRSGDAYNYAPFETRRMYAYPRSFYLSVTYAF